MENLKPFIYAIVATLMTVVFNPHEVAAQAKDSLSIETSFKPAGRMGCLAGINLDDGWRDNDPHSAPICTRISYQSSCTSIKWAGIYWTNKADDTGANWGQYSGVDLSRRGFKRITFWAKSEKGGEIIEFGTFGIDNTAKNPALYKYKDACDAIAIKVLLKPTWTKYTIDISTCQNMSSVIGGFYWSASAETNPAATGTGITFFLDDMQFEK